MAKNQGLRPDLASLAGVLLALGGILGGLLLEGGKISDIAQYTAALIVLGGTTGATMLNSPLPTFCSAFRRLATVFLEKQQPVEDGIDQIIQFATKARRAGIVSLEADVENIQDPFLKKALALAVDGADLQEIRSMMELEIQQLELRAESEAKVFEQAGGYAPTIGIIGAVLGLIQVMKNLANIDEVGHGIAVAFVATVYGVGVANLFFLPAAGKIKARAAEEVRFKEMMLEGVAAIVEGLNPKLIRNKLEAYAPKSVPRGQRRKGAARHAA
ncbi:MAG: flagellar motor protein [Bryobacteraceae bacterium]|nr:flagellar motor protein [Bryobacteraceae bacterium]MDW8379437.1 flagellar motor protein [Bryobacterales bacterium]